MTAALPVSDTNFMLLPKPVEASLLDLLAKLVEAVFRDLKTVVVAPPAEDKTFDVISLDRLNPLDAVFRAPVTTELPPVFSD